MKFQFYWGLFASLAAAFLLVGYTCFKINPIANEIHFSKFFLCQGTAAFLFLLFCVTYFVVGVISLFFKKSEKFAKGLLLSALLLLAFSIFLFNTSPELNDIITP